MSTNSFHSGLSSTFAYRSHAAFTSAAVARCTTPFSGPSQRIWLSPTIDRQNPAMSAAMSSTVLPTTCSDRRRIASTQSSVPRPVVKVSP